MDGNLTRRRWIRAGAAGVLPTLFARRKKPNVVVCLCDQLRAFEVGCYGNRVVRTPAIDRLAQEGFRFHTAVTNAPVCTPARSVLLSGQYTRAGTGELGNYADDPPAERRVRLTAPTLPELFRQHGYQTAVIGKWHIHPDPFLLGFEKAIYPASIWEHHYEREYWQAEHNRTGLSSRDGRKVLVREFGPAFLSTRVRDYLRDHSDRPFFLYYNIELPHMPLGPGNMPEKYWRMYRPEDIPLRPNVWRDSKLAHDERWFTTYLVWDYAFRRDAEGRSTGAPPFAPGFNLRDLAAYYYGAVTATDDLVGELMQGISENGLEENTIVVFLSDHGENLGSHHRFNKGLLIEESIRIPLIVRWPGRLKPSSNEEHVASTVDIMPTLLDLCGIGVPGHVQGRSLRPLLERRRTSLDGNFAFIETPSFQIGIRTPRHLYGITLRRPERVLSDSRLYYTVGDRGKGKPAISDDRFQFFDLKEDPYEMNNLAGTDQQADTAAGLRQRLVEWHRATPWLVV